jgi:uncharacterized small protein (TIGR04563 family)
MSPKRKVTLYFNSGMLGETQREAIRQDRSVSWIIQAAWKIARDEVRRLPGLGTLPVSVPVAVEPPVEPVRPAAVASAGGAPRRPVRE